MLPSTSSRYDHPELDPSPILFRPAAGRLIALITFVLVMAGCGGTTESDPGATSPSSALPPAGAIEPGPVELDVNVGTASTTTTLDPSGDWEVGGAVTASGILGGSFEVFPLCDVRNDADGEFLNIVFGYQDLADPAEPTVRVVTHIRGWRDQGDFDTTLEAQHQTGTGINLSLQDAAGTARVTITFIDSLGGAEVARIEMEGSFDGAVAGAFSANLTCIAG